MKKAFVLGILALLSGCGSGGTSDDPAEATPDTLIRVIPRTPIETGLLFSNALLMNDPACYGFLTPAFRDSVESRDLSPWEVFGRWRAFDPNGRLTEVVQTPDSQQTTSYYCTIPRLEELPPVVRFDFTVVDGEWLISGFGYGHSSGIGDSIALERQVGLILSDPVLLREIRIARMLLEDVDTDASYSWASWRAASATGESFARYITGLSQDSYNMLAQSNIRQSGKLQIVQDRATFQIPNPPLELRELVAAWRELAYLRKAVLRARHEAMQNLRQTGVWMEPDLTQEAARIQYLTGIFMPVSDLVEARDTLSLTYPALLTTGSGEPLEAITVALDPHTVEQKVENDIGVPVWRALGVDMNGDPDPERVVYWAGDLFLFLGTPTGYRLVFRTYSGYDSDFHGQFGTGTNPAGFSSVNLIGNSRTTEYNLFLDGGVPRLTATPLRQEEERSLDSYSDQVIPEDW
jgi:hypothetical protein